MIAFLGTGLLGGNFVRAFRRRGEEVHVWNRTHEKARLLEETGAKAFEHPADAVRGAARIHITVSDDAAVDALLAQAEPGIGPECIIIDHTTTSPAPTAERARRWASKGIRFLHAPVFMGPPNALDGTGTMIASGDEALFTMLEPALAPMTGKLVYLGADPSRAAAIKLMGNLFIVSMTAGISDMFALARSTGVPETEVAQIFSWFNPVTMAPARAERLRTADFSNPSWKMSMARKDVRLMIEAAAAGGGTLMVMPAIAAKMDEAIAAGHAGDDWMTIGREGFRTS
jgi:3-hydroxyisobutyrate dehydrogenase